jgi:hypothetical protein
MNGGHMDITTAPVGGSKLEWLMWFCSAIFSLFLGRTVWAEWIRDREAKFVSYVQLAYRAVESLKTTLPGHLDKTAEALRQLEKLLTADGKKLRERDAQKALVMWEALHGADKSVPLIKNMVSGSVGHDPAETDKMIDEIVQRVIAKLPK